jgi:hypothetical protein
MTRRTVAVEMEEIETTKSEKLLAVVLAAFLVVGGLWVYARLDDWSRAAVAPAVAARDRAAVERSSAAEERVAAAVATERDARDRLVLAREAYRTALDAGEPAAALRRGYEADQRAHAAAEAGVRTARRAAAGARPAALAAGERIASAERAAAVREARLGFALRFAFVALLLAAGLWLLARLRRAASRWLPLAFSVVALAPVLSLALAGDYVTDYVDPLRLGPLLLSLVGIGFTLAAFAVLQRYLSRRLPSRRVRRSECPFCGYPAGQGDHCEGCGRVVVAPCSSCARPRRVGTLHCRACGRA